MGFSPIGVKLALDAARIGLILGEMHSSASLPTDSFGDILARLPADLDLDALALQTKAIERKRKIGDGKTLLRVALARGPGGLSLSQTAAWAGMLGVARLSDPAIKFRLDKAVDFLDRIVARLLAGRTAGAAVHWPDACCASPTAAMSINRKRSSVALLSLGRSDVLRTSLV